jgi:hypothetical protein
VVNRFAIVFLAGTTAKFTIAFGKDVSHCDESFSCCPKLSSGIGCAPLNLEFNIAVPVLADSELSTRKVGLVDTRRSASEQRGGPIGRPSSQGNARGGNADSVAGGRRGVGALMPSKLGTGFKSRTLPATVRLLLPKLSGNNQSTRRSRSGLCRRRPGCSAIL